MNKREFCEAIRDFRNTSRLHRWVVRDIIEDAKDYNGRTFVDKVSSRLDDISHGLSTGIVSSLVYYRDTTAFYKRFREDIIDLFKEKATLQGESLGKFVESFNGWDSEDYFIEDYENRNICAWAAYEIIAADLSDIIYDLD